MSPIGGGDGTPMLLCPTCDEPVRPELARRCSQCGHDFGAGFDVAESSPALEGSPVRIAVCLTVIVVFIAAACAYVWRLF